MLLHHKWLLYHVLLCIFKLLAFENDSFDTKRAFQLYSAGDSIANRTQFSGLQKYDLNARQILLETI